MRPYQLVERAVGIRTRLYNNLDVEPVELPDGSTMYTVTSGLAATRGMHEETIAEGDELVRRRFTPRRLLAFADVVKLQPPAKGSGGEASLYRVEKPVAAVAAEARLPFRNAAVEMIATPDPDGQGFSPIRFNGITNTFYRIHPDIQQYPNETYLSVANDQGNIPLHVDHRANIEVTTIDTNNLDDELGVLTTVSGPARLTLVERYAARITDTGILYGPSESKTIDVDIPKGTPQCHDSDFYRIPKGAIVGPNDAGELVLKGSRAHAGIYEYTKLNPSIDPATILTLIPPDAIDWTDGTAAFIQTFSRRIARIMPRDMQTAYEQTCMQPKIALQRH